MNNQDDYKLESYMFIGRHLGIKTADQYRILAEECGALADEHVAAHEHDPMPFLVNPPTPSSNADMVAIGLATYRLARIARATGLASREVLDIMAKMGMH